MCFAQKEQEPDYENGLGRIVKFADVPLLAQVRARLPEFVGPKAQGLMVEGNYYYDVKTCGIGFHGDSERRRVVGVRIGQGLPLHYQWYHGGSPAGERVKLDLDGGDVYVMSEKATGDDWKKKKVLTLRHAAGAAKFLK